MPPTSSSGWRSRSSGAAASIAVFAGDNQTAKAGTDVPIPPSVIVKDANGNPVAGVTVNFGVSSGGGNATGFTTTTGTNGVATVGSWTLGPTPGTNNNTLSATAAGVTGGVTFTATGTP